MAESRKIPPRGPMRGMGQRPTNIKGVMPKILKLLFKNYGVAMVILKQAKLLLIFLMRRTTAQLQQIILEIR